MNRHRLAAAALLALAACSPAGGDPAARDPGPKSTTAGVPAKPYDEVDLLAKKRQYAESLIALEALRAAHGTEEAFLQREAELYRLQDQPEKAILLLRDTLAARPDAKTLYVPLAQVYLQVQQNDAAIEVLQRAEKAGADVAQVALVLGSALGRKQDFDGALAQFDRAEKAGAEHRGIIYNKALVLDLQQKYAEARALLEEALAASPDWTPAKRELGRVLIHGWPKEKAIVDRGMDLLWGVKDESKDDWRVMEGIGDGWLIAGDYDAAVEAYLEALRRGKNPKSVEDRYVVAVRKQREAKAAATDPPKKSATDEPK